MRKRAKKKLRQLILSECLKAWKDRMIFGSGFIDIKRGRPKRVHPKHVICLDGMWFRDA